MTDMFTNMPVWWAGPNPSNVMTLAQQQAYDQNVINTRLSQSAADTVAANNNLANQTFQQGQDDFWKWSDNATKLNAAYTASNLAIGNRQPVGTYNGNALSPFAVGTAPIQHLGGTNGLQPFNPGSYLVANPDVFKSGADPWQHYNQFGQNENRQGAWGNTTFDMSNYLANNPDVFKAGADPIQHWLLSGYDEGRQGGFGGPDFNEQNYLANNPDVFKAGADPVQHWLQYGQNENRTGGWGENPFNAQEYLLQNRDVAASGMDPTAHWMQFGANEGREAAFGGTEAADWSKYFNQAGTGSSRDAIAAAYLTANPDVFNAAKASGQDPTAFGFEHFQNYGGNEDRRMFDAAEYLRENPDVFAAGADPYQHYSQFGQAEGRYAPTGTFNPESYLAYNPDVAAAGANPWQHYTQFGIGEGRRGAWEGDDSYLMMAAGDDFPYGNPTGVGGSGYGDGYGGYGHNWESPYPIPPGANLADPKSYWVSNNEPNIWEASRAPYTKALANDPARMYDMAVRLYLELNNDPVGRQGIAEAMFNRYAARTKYPSGAPIDPLAADYFPKSQKYLNKYADATSWLRTQPELLARIYGEIGRAAGGSNITNAATDWASDIPGHAVASEAAKYSTETWQSPNEGERFFRKDISNSYAGPEAARQIQEWYRNMMSLQPQWPQ